MSDLPLSSILITPTGSELTHLPADPEAPPVHTQQSLEEIFSHHPSGCRVESALSAGSVLMMILTLPATDADEIEGMVELQAEEISPFPPERTCVSWELLDQAPPQSRILLALCSRKELEDLKNPFAAKAMIPKRVDVDVMGWLEVMKTEEILLPDQDALILILHGDTSTVIAWNQGTPCLIRSLVQARELSGETLREELMLLSLSLESDFDLDTTSTLQVWVDGEAPAWVNEPIEGWNFETHLLKDLPPLTLGLARRGLLDSVLDLSPKEWKEEEARQKNKQKNLRTLVTVAGGWLVLMLGFLGWAQFRQSDYRALKKENTSKLSAVKDVQELTVQVRSLTQFTDRSSSALEMLLFIATATPGRGNMVIDDFRYEKDEGITFSGTLSGDVQPFYQFLENFGESDQLQVKDYDLKEAKQGFEFQVEAVWAWLAAEEDEEQP